MSTVMVFLGGMMLGAALTLSVAVFMMMKEDP